MRTERLRSAWVGVALWVAGGAMGVPAAAQTMDAPSPPAATDDPNAPVQRELRVQRDRNQALNERLAALEQALDGDVCANPDAMALLVRPQELQPRATPAEELAPVPGDAAADPAAVPEEAGDAPSPGRRETETAALPPPLPAATEATTQPLSRRQMVANLKQAAVLVLAPKGTGSGFFVAPDKVMTNQHVIASAGDGVVHVVGYGTGRPMRARVIAKERGKAPGTADYALLDVPGANIANPLALTSSSVQLQNVIAAGYPALLLGTDKSFLRLTRGDMAAMPELGFSGGEISAIQPQGQGLATIAHTAAISGGNSGGPLVDRCGRVVGANTFINVSAKQGQNAGFAIASPDIIRFLRQNGVAVNVKREPCTE